MALTRDPSCPRCGKPIRHLTASQFNGQPIHLRCLAEETARRSRKATDRAADVPARRALERSPTGRRACPVCQHDLMNGRALLFQGEELVHAGCWRATPAA